jgi:hypothetical protein
VPVTVRCAAGYMLENPVNPQLLVAAITAAVTTREVRKTSRKGSGSPMDSENPQRPYAGPLPSTRKRMRWSVTHGDVGGWGRAPVLVPDRNGQNGSSEIPCRVNSCPVRR